MEAQSLSTCNQCGKKFQRKAHLLRHQQQHSGDRPYSCKFCSKTFKRSDVLRDHFSRCDRRGSSAIPSSLERGRKRHACDECSRLKVKCDNNVPCRKCVEFGRKCVKSRPSAASSPEESTPSATTPDPSSDRNSIGFLLNCPGETDFLREFPKSTTLSPNNQSSELSSVTTIRNGFAPLPSVHQQYGHMIQENNLDVFLSHLEFQQTFEQETNNWQVIGAAPISSLGPDPRYLDRAALEQRAFDIKEKLRHAAATHHFPHLPPKELLQAVELITANNIAEYIQLYFKHWHKHAPLVQEAHFNPCTSALPLVLALMCLGGMYSKEPKDVTKLKTLLDTIEGFIYSIPGLSDEYDSPGRQYVKQGENAAPEWQQYQLEELQGAYLMVVLQYWTGNPVARTRVRQQRFTRIVAIFHQLDLPAIQHLTYEIKDQQTFRAWMRKESLIRTAGIAMMLDHAFGILNNFAPRFQWAEIDLPFPCDEVFFKLSTYEEMISRSLFPQPKMKVKEGFLNLFSPPESADENLRVMRAGKLTGLDMQMLIHLLYTHVWTQTFSNPLISLPGTSIPALIAPFRTALRNWKIIWDEIKASTLESEWNKLGFQTTSETYYDAINAIVGVFEKRDGKFPPFPSDCEKGSHLKRLLSL